MHASDLIDILMERGRFTDTIIDGEIYNAVKLKGVHTITKRKYQHYNQC